MGLSELAVDYVSRISDEDRHVRQQVAAVVAGVAVLVALAFHVRIHDAFSGPRTMEASAAARLAGVPYFGRDVQVVEEGKLLRTADLVSTGVDVVQYKPGRSGVVAWYGTLRRNGSALAVKVPSDVRVAPPVKGYLRAATAPEREKLDVELVLDATAPNRGAVGVLIALGCALAVAFCGWVFWNARKEPEPVRTSLFGA